MFLQRGYIILIAGAVLFISGIVISALWAGSFAGTFLRESTIIGQTLIKPSESVNASLQVNDIARPIAVAIHFKPNSKRSSRPSGKQKHICKRVFYRIQATDYRKIYTYSY